MSRVGISLVAFSSAVAVTALVCPVYAQDSAALPSTRHRKYESPQNFAVEFRGGSYRPEIDSDPSLTPGASPYGNTFGGRRALIAIELDWQAIRIPHLGTIGPGLSMGYTRMSAQAPIHGYTNVLSKEDTYLEIIPFYGVGVLRADVFMRELRIPLVPYGKIGVGYALWNSSTGEGISRAPDVRNPDYPLVARGGTWGTHFAIGIALELNVFDQQTARNFDTGIGVNHTYVFIEAMRMNLNGLGKKNTLPVGDVTWATGLAFEF